MSISKQSLSIPKLIAISFLCVILVGTFLLSLPIAQLATSKTNFFSNLFNAISCTCVTGLWIEPIATSYSGFGQLVCLLMIQIGGLGLMTIVAYFILLFGKKIDFSNQMLIKESLNKEDFFDIRKFLLKIIKYTFVIESLGAIGLAFVFVPKFGWFRGILNSIFVAISSFCNAGYDNFSTTSLTAYAHDFTLNSIIPILVILGGIGFSVWFDVSTQFKQVVRKKVSIRKAIRQLSIHSKLAIITTAILLLVPTILMLLTEFNNPLIWENSNFLQRLQISFFQSTSMRTAGFSTVDYTLLKPVTLFLYILVMFVGGSPGGTAGGIKTTTFSLVLLSLRADLKAKGHVNLFKHTLDNELIKKAFLVVWSFVLLLISAVYLILLFDPQISLLSVLFESVSALATVGVSMNLTPMLSTASQVVLMILMFAGRIGPITLLLSLAKKKREKELTFTQGHVLIG